MTRTIQRAIDIKVRVSRTLLTCRWNRVKSNGFLRTTESSNQLAFQMQSRLQHSYSLHNVQYSHCIPRCDTDITKFRLSSLTGQPRLSASASEARLCTAFTSRLLQPLIQRGHGVPLNSTFRRKATPTLLSCLPTKWVFDNRNSILIPQAEPKHKCAIVKICAG